MREPFRCRCPGSPEAERWRAYPQAWARCAQLADWAAAATSRADRRARRGERHSRRRRPMLGASCSRWRPSCCMRCLVEPCAPHDRQRHEDWHWPSVRSRLCGCSAPTSARQESCLRAADAQSESAARASDLRCAKRREPERMASSRATAGSESGSTAPDSGCLPGYLRRAGSDCWAKSCGQGCRSTCSPRDRQGCRARSAPADAASRATSAVRDGS
jgi:hypothetical protein